MGLKTSDLTAPIYGPTTLTPPGKDHLTKTFTLARTDTVADVKAVLPASATIMDFRIYGPASNAATTATINLGTTVAATEILNAQDVKTAGGLVRPTTSVQSFVPNLEPVPWVGDIQIWAKYAETGTASTLGGPWVVMIDYIP